jgi:hypothetical protein
MARAVASVVLLLASVVAVVGMVPGSPAAPAGAATVRSFGDQPLQDVINEAWAFSRPECGLEVDRLAAMMLVMTFSETGAVNDPSRSPGPMTLSRWDTQQALWAFGSSSTPYQRAFWHPGVGAWQFDSAGFWPLTAATAISTETSARQAAQVMSSRYCASSAPNPDDRMRYAWSPWYYCASAGENQCLQRFRELYDGRYLTNVRRDATTSRLGGMQERRCRIAGAGDITCFRVDPARAEGHRGWTSPNGAPTPVTAPFYSYELDGREHRTWLRQDTGYDRTITASKPVAANARTSLTWTTGDTVCDLVTTVGACTEVVKRVLVAPWGSFSENPVGSMDTGRGEVGQIQVDGWTIDPDTNDPIQVHVYVNGQGAGATTADAARPDVAAAIPGYGDRHGYRMTIPWDAGPAEVCAYAINVGPYGTTNPLLGCRSTVVSARPVGNLESATAAFGGVRVSGWVLDADAPTTPMSIEVTVDGAPVATGTADGLRGDVGTAYPGTGGRHGLSLSVPASPGTRQVCVRARDLPTDDDVPLGCRTVSVPGPNPIGNFESVRIAPGGVEVSGWVIDPDGSGPSTLRVTVDGTMALSYVADDERADVGAAYPGFGAEVGYRSIRVPAAPGSRRVCIRTVDQPGTATVSLGCRAVQVPGPGPFGNYESAQPVPGGVEVSGWVIDPDVDGVVSLRVRVDGTLVSTGTTGAVRTDVGAAYPAFGDDRGFRLGATVSAGSHQVCVDALDAPGAVAVPMGCRSVTIGAPPFGNFEALALAPAGIGISGWVIDPDDVGQVSIQVELDGVFAGVADADALRSDVGSAYPAYGDRHGIRIPVVAAPGSHRVCVRALDDDGGPSRSLGCRTAVIPAVPFGNVESVVRSGDGFRASGWALDPSVDEPVAVEVVVGPRVVRTIAADGVRTDVGDAYPWFGSGRGISVVVPGVAPGTAMCLRAVTPGLPVTLGCRTVP